MSNTWTSLVWPFLPKEMQIRLRYTVELATNLFVALPIATKRTFISHVQHLLGYPTFIETGTFLGDMSLHASTLFQRVHTVELSPLLAKRATDRLARLPNVTVHQGDSGEVLRDLLATLDTSCVFWLDAHYSGSTTARGEVDTPIAAELEAIADHAVRPHVILIDDARCFGTDDAYPTLEVVFALLRRVDSRFQIGVSSDIIWAAPNKILNFQWSVSPSGTVIPPTTAWCAARKPPSG